MGTNPYIGAIFIFAGNFAPRGYQLCQGQLLPISQYAALFSILGTTYGGNGTTNFALSDLRARSPIGQGTPPGLSPVALGQMGGVQNVTLLSSNLPPHNHLINVSAPAGGAGANTPQNNFLAGTNDGQGNPYPSYNTTATSGATLAATSVTTVGSGTPNSVENPYLGINYIIAIQGIFPTRN
jgi:microcystin-dependent protein